ncbi:MAG: hypothetical protein MZU84_09280 [Sphingobacterium sp.]|nr:hypothetical protein [Sphingobacterium sp.]
MPARRSDRRRRSAAMTCALRPGSGPAPGDSSHGRPLVTALAMSTGRRRRSSSMRRWARYQSALRARPPAWGCPAGTAFGRPRSGTPEDGSVRPRAASSFASARRKRWRPRAVERRTSSARSRPSVAQMATTIWSRRSRPPARDRSPPPIRANARQEP